jgi:quercetin dioxygenase-like cupin family protein
VPIEIRRFGFGNRRPHGPPGSTGLTGQVIHSDASGVVAELAFSRGGRIEPHANPNACWFIVIEGGGWVQVGDERTRVAAGDAIAWPPDLPHGAWTETSEMRAFVVEFSTGSGAAQPVLEGRAASQLPPGNASPGAGDAVGATPGEGALRDDPGRAAAGYDPDEGEPL